jgi:hypothetical protein
MRPLARHATSRSVPRYRFTICGVSANIPTGLRCGGLFWGRHCGLLGQLLVVASGAPFIRALWCLTRSHTALATGTSRHSACGREWGTVQPGWCLTRSHSGRWSDNRWWAILGVATGIARIRPVVRAEATAHADARFGPPPLAR